MGFLDFVKKIEQKVLPKSVTRVLDIAFDKAEDVVGDVVDTAKDVVETAVDTATDVVIHPKKKRISQKEADYLIRAENTAVGFMIKDLPPGARDIAGWGWKEKEKYLKEENRQFSISKPKEIFD